MLYKFYIINPQFFEIRSTQPGHPSVDKSNEYQLPLGSKRAYHTRSRRVWWSLADGAIRLGRRVGHRGSGWSIHRGPVANRGRSVRMKLTKARYPICRCRIHIGLFILPICSGSLGGSSTPSPIPQVALWASVFVEELYLLSELRRSCIQHSWRKRTKQGKKSKNSRLVDFEKKT